MAAMRLARKRLLQFGLIALAVVGVQALLAGPAFAVYARTATDISLYAGPGTGYTPIVGIVKGAAVQIESCQGNWCRAHWKGYSGFARKGSLQFPNLPPYRYRSGYYPDADAYYSIPPYADIPPSFYRKRYFMMAQERNRWRYWPHRFTGNAR
jgi:uncharacterized protein YraI